MPNPMQSFTLTPSLNGTEIQWEMCHTDTNTNKSKCGIGNNQNPFPWVALGSKKGKYDFEVTIVDNANLGVNFDAAKPIVIKDGDPKQQIKDVVLKDPKTLTFTDLNTKPDKGDPEPVVLDYQLNFTGHPAASPIDPIIINGGSQTRAWSGQAELTDPSSIAFWILMGMLIVASVIGSLLGRMIKAGR